MTITHHLSDDLLMSYSAGRLPEAFALVVATHISLCDDCRARLLAFDAVGGALVERCGTVAMRDDSLEAVLARLDDTPPAAPVPRRRGGLPQPLQDYLGCDLSEVKWRSVGMGVRQSVLPTERGASARLLYIPSGAALPDHGHRGMELTLVLQGAFIDDGARFGPGDIEIADAQMQHTPIADIGSDCICLAATDARLRFNGVMQRIAQPFLGI